MDFKRNIPFIALISTITIFYQTTLFAQTDGVLIDYVGNTRENSAVLDVRSSNQGFLAPRVVLTASNVAAPVSSPANGLMVYNTNATGSGPTDVQPGYYYWNGTSWVRLMSGNTTPLSGSGAATRVAFWDGVNSLSSDADLYWDNTANKSLGIGTASPGSYKLNVQGGSAQSLIQSSSDAPLVLRGTNTWSGIGFIDVNGSDHLWYNGENSTFAIGGGGSNVSGKKLHIDGATSIGSSYDANSPPTNGLIIQGNVGIGTPSPGYNLDVSGNTRTTGDFYGDIHVDDTRSVNDPPNTYNNEVAFDFKNRTTIGVPGSGTYSGNMTIAPWGDNTGDANHQMNFNEGGLYWRQGQPNGTLGSDWGAWQQILTATPGSNPVTGTGTTNYVTKWLNTTTVGTAGDGALLGTSGSSSATRTLTLLENGDSQLNFGSYPGAWTSALQIQNNDNTDFVWISPLDGSNNARLRTGGTGLDIYVGGGNDAGTHSTTFKSDGNVGIGSTNPLLKLKVDGDIEANNQIRATGWLTAPGTGAGAEIGVSGGYSYFHGYDRTAGNYIPSRVVGSTIDLRHSDSGSDLFVDNSGKVGINNNTPDHQLDVAGNVNAEHILNGPLVARPNATWSESGNTSGAIIIKLPGIAGTNYGMLHMEINVYEYSGDGVTTFIIGGHNWSNRWYNYNCHTIGSTDKKVRLVVKDGQYAVVIGEQGSSWSYGHVVLSKITNGEYYVNNMDLSGSYTVYRDNAAESWTWTSGDLNSNSNPSVNTNYIQNQTSVDQVAAFRINGNGLFNGGSVGVGVTSPAAKLHVHESTTLGSSLGSSQLLSRISGHGPNVVMKNEWLYRDAASPTNWFTTRWHDGISVDGSFLTPGTDTKVWWERDPNHNIQSWGNAASTYMTMKSGSLGIGTTTPGARLHISGTTSETARIQSSGAEADIHYLNNNTTWQVGTNNSGNGTDNNHFYLYDSTYRLSVQKGTGNVGVGTTSPETKLEVAGDILRTNTRVNNSQRYPVAHNTGEDMLGIDPTWTDAELQAYFDSPNVAWNSDASAPSGWSIKVTGKVNVGGVYGSGFPYIPVEDGATYYMECWIRQESGSAGHYMGGVDYDQNFSSLGGNPGSYGYWTMSNTSINTTWTKVTGNITGYGTAIGQFKTGTKYWTPMALFNYNGGGNCYISGWKVTKVSTGGSSSAKVTFTDTDTQIYNDQYIQIRYQASGEDIQVAAKSGHTGWWDITWWGESHEQDPSNSGDHGSNDYNLGTGWTDIQATTLFSASMPSYGGGAVIYVAKEDSNTYPLYEVRIIRHGTYITALVNVYE